MSTVSVRYIVNDVDAAIAFCVDHLAFAELMHPRPGVRDACAWYSCRRSRPAIPAVVHGRCPTAPGSSQADGTGS